MSKELDALVEAFDGLGSPENAKPIMDRLNNLGYIITLDPTPLDGSDTKGANLALQRLRELGYVVSFEG